MTLRRQMTFWLAALAALVVVLVVLHQILLPFVAGMAVAYLLDPLANRLDRYGINRTVATLVIVGLFVLVFLVLAMLIVPVLGHQLTTFIDHLPTLAKRLQALVTDPNRPWLRKIVGENFADVDKSIADLMTQGAGWLTTFVRSLWSGGQALISIFSVIVVTPVVAFYLIHDWPRMVTALDRWLPRDHADTIRALAREIDAGIAGYVRGQSVVCLILAAYYAIGLSLTGLNFGLLIGIAAGITSFIPFVGSFGGLILAIGVALAQFWPDWTPIVAVAVVFFVGQFCESYILGPKLVGESIGLHPVWLMFALFAFGYLFGFVGLLVAVPLAAACGVLLRFALRQYLASPLYTGSVAEKDMR